MIIIPPNPTDKQKLAVVTSVIDLLADYDKTTLGSADNCASFMLALARYTRNYLNQPTETNSRRLSSELRDEYENNIRITP